MDSPHFKPYATHRKVMMTLQRFIEDDDMDFDETPESVVEKRKFLLNRVMRRFLADEYMMMKKQNKGLKPQCPALN